MRFAVNDIECSLKVGSRKREARKQLARIKYFKTYIAIHGDSSVMPADQSDWGEVNVAFVGLHSAILSAAETTKALAPESLRLKNIMSVGE